MTLFGGIYVLELYTLYKVSRRLPDLNITTISLNLILLAIVIYFITRKLSKTYRVHIDGTWIVLGIMLPVTAYFLQSRIEVFFQSPVHVKEMSYVKRYPDQKFFTVSNFSCDTTLTGYYLSVSSGGKSSTAMNHYFTSPVITREDSPSDLKHQYWVSDSYRQKVFKLLSNEDKNRERITFMNRKLHDFNRMFRKTPAFFEVVYSDLNPRAKAKNYLFSVLSIGRIRNPVFILKPHAENFKTFIRSNEKQGLILVTIFSVLLALNAFMIARYR